MSRPSKYPPESRERCVRINRESERPIAASGARAVHSARGPGDRGFQVIEPPWNPGRFNHAAV